MAQISKLVDCVLKSNPYLYMSTNQELKATILSLPSTSCIPTHKKKRGETYLNFFPAMRADWRIGVGVSSRWMSVLCSTSESCFSSVCVSTFTSLSSCLLLLKHWSILSWPFGTSSWSCLCSIVSSSRDSLKALARPAPALKSKSACFSCIHNMQTSIKPPSYWGAHHDLLNKNSHTPSCPWH